MKRGAKSPPTDVDVSDGTHHTGMICPRDGAFEAHSDSAGYLGKYPTQREAAQAIVRAARVAA